MNDVSRGPDAANLDPQTGMAGTLPSVGDSLDERRVSRRALFSSLRGVVAASAAAAAAVGTAVRASPPSVSADVDPGSLGLKLIRRITFGVNQEEMTLFSSMGYQGYLEYHLNCTAIPDDYINQRLAGEIPGIQRLNTLFMTGEELHATFPPELPVNELTDATILRAVYSKRQLFEKMVEFWSDHFSMDIHKSFGWVLKTINDREVIRVHALGNFRDMLQAIVRSPAMLNYLDNDRSIVNNINENYARELMEVQTLSVTAGYTQSDVIAMARCLSGRGRYDENAEPSSLRGTFRYVHAEHDQGEKVFSPLFNLTGSGPYVVPAGQGELVDGDMIADVLAYHPSTAKFIATKLCHRFIGDDCPQAVIDSVKAAYLNNGQGVVGDIKAMLRVMLRPNVIADAKPRIKRPFHLFVSALRAVPVTISDLTTVRLLLDAAGHAPFSWPPPNGYPDTDAYWGVNTLPRWRFGASLVTDSAGNPGGIDGVLADTEPLFVGATTQAQVMDALDAALFQGELPTAERSRMLATLSANPTLAERTDLVGLAMGTPAYQFY